MQNFQVMESPGKQATCSFSLFQLPVLDRFRGLATKFPNFVYQVVLGES